MKVKATIALVVVVMIFSVTEFAVARKGGPPTPTQSVWVKNQIAEFQKRYEVSGGFSRPFAWGTGTYQGERVEWFAYSNTDAYFQIHVSSRMDAKDAQKIRQTLDRYGRNWSTKLLLNPGANAITWIGISNDWPDNCSGRASDCDGMDVTNVYVRELNRRLQGRLNLTVAEYLE